MDHPTLHARFIVMPIVVLIDINIIDIDGVGDEGGGCGGGTSTAAGSDGPPEGDVGEATAGEGLNRSRINRQSRTHCIACAVCRAASTDARCLCAASSRPTRKQKGILVGLGDVSSVSRQRRCRP